jgi:hypothetical protein
VVRVDIDNNIDNGAVYVTKTVTCMKLNLNETKYFSISHVDENMMFKIITAYIPTVPHRS